MPHAAHGSIIERMKEFLNGGDTVIDEKRVIARLENRIDSFVKAQPEKKGCAEVQAIKEFIHILELEAEYEGGEQYGFRKLTESEREARKKTMKRISKSAGESFDGE